MVQIADCKGQKWTISRSIVGTRANGKVSIKCVDSSITKSDKVAKTVIRIIVVVSWVVKF